MLVFIQACYVVMFTSMLLVELKGHKTDIRGRFGPKLGWLIDLGSMTFFLFLPVACVNIVGAIMCNPFDRPKITRTLYNSPFICFRTVTKGICPGHVTRCVLRNKHTCLSAGLKNFEIEAVTDNVLNLPKEKHIRETLVPAGYKTQNDTKYKGRALHYCLEPSVNHLGDDDWVVHLDEESLLTEDCIIGICEFIHENRGDIGQGPINCSSAIGEIIPSWFITLTDCYRVGIDYCSFRFQLDYLNMPLFGFKGSYIVLKNKTGVEVGFDSGIEGSVTEDCYFALKAWDKGYSFGYIKGEMREQSPFSLIDFVQQRKRWFMGHVYICFAQHLPLTAKLGIGINVICCIVAPLSMIAGIANIFSPFFSIYHVLAVGVVSGSFSWAMFLGTFMSFQDRQWSICRLFITSVLNSLVIFPLAFMMHIASALWGLATINAPGFHIVQKDAELFEKKKQ